MSRLGGDPPGSMPQDGSAYVLVDGVWVRVATDETDGIPSSLSLPGDNDDGGGSGGTAAVA